MLPIVLYCRHRKAFDALLAESDRLRRVQASSLRAVTGGRGPDCVTRWKRGAPRSRS